jgi:hypothetical protein
MSLADDFISPPLKFDLDRRLRSERVIPGAEMKREFREWRKRRGRP